MGRINLMCMSETGEPPGHAGHLPRALRIALHRLALTGVDGLFGTRAHGSVDPGINTARHGAAQYPVQDH
jgi:hypothetical protein